MNPFASLNSTRLYSIYSPSQLYSILPFPITLPLYLSSTSRALP